jgi:hypothetical protein
MKITRFAAFILILLIIAACSLPDYQLSFQITGWTVNVDTVTVYYTLTNIGVERLVNARVRIAIAEADGTIISEEWTDYNDIEVGESKSSSISIFDSSGGNFDHATVTGAGWDTE